MIKQIGIDTLYPNDTQKEGLFSPLFSILSDALKKLEPPEELGEEQQENLALSKAAERFEKRLDVNLEKESSVITVSFEHKDPALAVKVLDVLLNLYMEKRKALYLESRVDMAKTHAEEARQRVLIAENALENFKRTHNIMSFDAERQSLITERSAIQMQSTTVDSPSLREKLSYLEDKLARLNKDEAQFNALTHDATVANDEYAVFAHRLSEATAYEDIEHERAGSVRIIQPPAAPAEPKKLQFIIIIAGFVLSLLSALVTAIILDTLSSGFSTPEHLAKSVGLPVLVVLPRRK